MAEGFVLTFPATAGWVDVVPVFDITFLVTKGGGFDFTTFFGIYYCKKYSEESSLILLGIWSYPLK